MAVQAQFQLAKTKVFTLHDDSQQARVVLGPSFRLRAEEEPSPLYTWEDKGLLCELCLSGGDDVAAIWGLGLENAHMPASLWRGYAVNTENNQLHYLHADSERALTAQPEDAAEHLPESVYGALLGLAVGASEAQNLLEAAKKRDATPASAEDKRRDWRAPQHIFTLQTAAGSPFVERWGFSMQESALHNKRFRIWVEQQRTGRELQLLLLDNGDVEGVHEIETLPAAIHGAALGLLMGADAVVERFYDKPAKAGHEPAHAPRQAARPFIEAD